MIKRILVALSGTPFTPAAVRYAIDLARADDAVITGVTLVDDGHLDCAEPIGGGSAAAAAAIGERTAITRQRVEEAISSFRTQCETEQIDYRIERETGDPMDHLTKLSRCADLTIFGLRGMFEYGVVRNPDDMVTRLISHGVRPVFAVPREHRPIQRVMVAYDGSIAAAKAMKMFVQLRLWPNANISVVCSDHHGTPAPELIEEASAYCRAHGFETETDILHGKPGNALLNHVASWDADLMVMGSTHRGRLIQFLLGDTALRALRDSTIPLFLSQ